MPEQADREFLVIICETGTSGEVIRHIEAAGVVHYTIHRGATGCGETGRHEGTPVWPGDCTTVFACVGKEQVGPILQELTALHSSRGRHSLGLKVFSLPAHELL